ncbi:MAG: hypothetical protein GXX91_01190 [Verrucomicrobiaceae bacterium]|nr:hypothetical protein [Verrucomicrobiaceae bacterium]
MIYTIGIFATLIAIPINTSLGVDLDDNSFELIDLSELARRNNQIQVYRVGVDRSFDPEIVFELHVWDSSKKGKLYVQKRGIKEVDGALEPTRIVKKSAVDIDSNQIKCFTDLFSQCDFWNLPKKDIHESLNGDVTTTDGSVWTIEVVEGGMHKKLKRRNPIFSIKEDPNGSVSASRISKEFILITSCVWIWVFGDEAGERIY